MTMTQDKQWLNNLPDLLSNKEYLVMIWKADAGAETYL